VGGGKNQDIVISTKEGLKSGEKTAVGTETGGRGSRVRGTDKVLQRKRTDGGGQRSRDVKEKDLLN